MVGLGAWGLMKRREMSMKTKSTYLAMLCSIALFSPGLLATADEVKEASGDWWDIPYPEPFDASKIETTLQFIHVGTACHGASLSHA